MGYLGDKDKDYLRDKEYLRQTDGYLEDQNYLAEYLQWDLTENLLQTQGGSTPVTFVRTGSSYYLDADLTLQTAAENIPTFQPIVNAGMITDLARTNLFLNTETLSTQTVTVAATTHTVSFYGTGTITFSGTYSGSLAGTGATTRVTKTFTTTAGGLVCTVSGTVSFAQIEASGFATPYIPSVETQGSRGLSLSTLPISLLPTSGFRRLSCQFTPYAPSDGNLRAIWSSQLNPTNYLQVRYGPNDIAISKAVSGTITFASIGVVISPGVTYSIEWFIYDDNTLGISVDGTLATGGSTAAPVLNASTMEIGSRAGSVPAAGQIKNFRIG